MPALGQKLKRIASGNKKSAFMGTDFAYEDLRSEKLEAHAYTLLREEECQKESCDVVEAKPASPEEIESTGYRRRVFWIQKDNLTTLKTEYYDKTDRLLKTATAYEIQPVKGEMMRPDKVLMTHHQNNHKTLMGTMERDVSSPLDDDLFSESSALNFR